MKKQLEFYSGGAAFLLAFAMPMILGTIAMLLAAQIVSSATSVAIEVALTSDAVTFVGLAATQIVMFIITLFFTRGGKDIPAVCNFNKPTNKKDWLFAVLLSLGMVFGMGILSSLFMLFLSIFGYTPTASPFPDMTNLGNYLTAIVVVCIMPAFSEELMFRGVILNSVSAKGKRFGIIMSALLFMLMHASPLQTIYQFAYGIIFAIVAVQTKSVLLGVLMHFINNFVAITLEFLGLGGAVMPGYVVLLGIVLVVVSLRYFIMKDAKKYKKTELFDESEAAKKTSDEIVDNLNIDVSEAANSANNVEGELAINNEAVSDKNGKNDLIEKLRILNIKAYKKMAIVLYGIGILACLIYWVMQFIQGL